MPKKPVKSAQSCGSSQACPFDTITVCEEIVTLDSNLSQVLKRPNVCYLEYVLDSFTEDTKFVDSLVVKPAKAIKGSHVIDLPLNLSTIADIFDRFSDDDRKR